MFTIFKAVRPFTIQATGHDGYALTAPTGSPATFTINVNGGSIGTITFAASSNSVTGVSITSTPVATGGRIEFVQTTGNGIQDYSITLAGLY